MEAPSRQRPQCTSALDHVMLPLLAYIATRSLSFNKFFPASDLQHERHVGARHVARPRMGDDCTTSAYLQRPERRIRSAGLELQHESVARTVRLEREDIGAHAETHVERRGVVRTEMVRDRRREQQQADVGPASASARSAASVSMSQDV